ncbi:FAD-dependent oxidoreductase [Glycomyces artemisiae]|uniref:2-polyprenyl-6-methoxyphenol hydroxylase-like FAD-dependent oxidoreductase n=1 Tax=Glycomyces artemisiae TaxID=1076443 RepID=A0A2T0UPS4_9ACTN|nr:FAD-dependent oxidoreductase [Glycomyces artemisiae]PRY59868.1 2-polyprenyl-6-methoxyphenol hydroxylase-like FAD-dependent oxidoreductase [Glycomyces artemisiae]
MGTPGQRRALIVGAGIAGLAAALRLHRAGWRTLVVERAPERRSGGYMINLVDGGFDAAEHLGLVPALKERDLGLFTSIIVGADGTAKFAVPEEVVAAAVGPRALTVFRGDLETVLYQAVRDTAEFRFGTTVTEIDQDSGGVTAALSDGRTERADLLVGADGLHSATRALVFGPEADHLVDMGHMVGALPLDGPPLGLDEGTGTTFIGVGRTAALISLGPGRSSAFFAYRTDDTAAQLELGAAQALSEAFGDLGGGVPDALRRLRENPDPAYFDSASQIRMDAWSRGRVVLLGDAAWCVTLFAGYGAALAMSGADRLGDALEREVDIATALSSWESNLRPEVRRRQALARRGMVQFAPPTKGHIWMNETAMRAMRLAPVRKLMARAARTAK